jgi:hypothetical protein
MRFGFAILLSTVTACGSAAANDPEFTERPDELTGHEKLRVYEADELGVLRPVAIENLPKLRLPSVTFGSSVDVGELESAIDAAEANRKRRLSSSSHVNNGVPRAEDGSLGVVAFHMALLGDDRTSYEYPMQLGGIGQIEGFRVLLRTTAAAAMDLRELKKSGNPGLSNVELLGIPGFGDFWSEDQGELDAQANVSVPAHIADVDAMSEAMVRSRVRRLYPAARPSADYETLKRELPENYPLAAFSVAGNVARGGTRVALASVAVARTSKLRVNLSYVEGGNMLVGRLESGEPYALVGRDNIESTRYVLETDLGHKVTDDDIHAAIASDVGVAPERLYPVEEPGDFHLDMRMALFGPGTVLLDDSRAAVDAQLKWERDDYEAKHPGPDATGDAKAIWAEETQRFEMRRKNLETYVARQTQFEAMVLHDLEKTPLKVGRVAAVYANSRWPGEQEINFINAESGTNAKGERFYIALGAHARAEKAFAASMRAIGGLSRLYFLDRNLTPKTLEARGGIGCRVKAEGP